MNIGMDLQQRQQLTMTPQLHQALRLLQLSSLEFNQEIETALSNNPFLEELELPATPGNLESDPSTVLPQTQAENAERLESSSAETIEATTEAMSAQTESEESPSDWRNTASGSHPASDDLDWTDWSEAPVSLPEHLRKQVLLWPLSERDRILVNLLIDELSDAGYLETPLEELLECLPAENKVTVKELEAALKVVQQLEPAGIGARTLQECLQLQLAELPTSTLGLADAEIIVAKHFDLLAKRQFHRLEQLLACNENTLHQARALIRTLDPRPGRCYAKDDVRYIVPDVIVVQQGKIWEAKMNPAVQPAIRLNHGYAEIAGRRGAAPSCSHMLQEARWLLRNITQRFDTIKRVADAIIKRQKVFLAHGEAAMKPLSLKDIAGEVGLHESTICRVSNGKYMATPRGLFEFKYFFSRQLPTSGGSSCSTMAIRALIKALVAAEDPLQPLSDVQLAKLLSAQGFKLVRRTVTKYRNQLRIPSVELRRVQA